ncbi:hypothetical protein LY39_00821 [Roseinatronobacter bogoriensis subsp. barguzinensis]|nr:hypothetical protein LY39_00821 [Rhodobaca barguzinensis]TDY74109.1 hypothetical protein EV660_101143 [Rhodobaca bogoriensis DSM 18756]
MKIAMHLGVHLTDDKKARTCLRANKPMLEAAGILVPRASSYLNLMRGAAGQVVTGAEIPDFDEKLRASVEATDSTQRLVLSAPGLLAKQHEAVEGNMFYPGARARISAFRKLLQDHEVEIFMAIRNPASFVPALLQDMKEGERAELMQGLKGAELRWSHLIAEMRETWPEAPITLWCDEDTPFIWHRLLRLISGYEPETEFENSFDWFETAMIDGGAQKLAAYLDAMPPVDEAHRQQVISAFLEKFCDPDKLEIDFSLTGWDETQIDVISQLYEDDIELIRTMEGVRLLQP